MKYWIKAIFYDPKHEKPTDENIFRLLMPSFVGIIVCMVCLAGSTWAWFYASIQVQPQTIAAANFNIVASIKDANDNEIPITSKGSYALSQGSEYKVTLTAVGTADKFGGYCMVEGAGASHYTDTMLPDDTLSFTFIPQATSDYTFTAVWGKYSGTADISADKTIGGKANDSAYTANPTDRDKQ